MIGKRAKILTQAQVEDLLFFAQHTRNPLRNQVIVLLSVKAGLRAAEIANLTWEMVVDPMGEIATTLELQDRVAKKGSGRVIPIHPDLREALVQLRSKLLKQMARSFSLSAVVRCGPSPSCAGLPKRIAPLGLRVVRRILAAGLLLRERRGWFTRLAPHSGMCSCSQVIGHC